MTIRSPRSSASAWRSISCSIARATYRIEFRFLISTRVPERRFLRGADRDVGVAAQVALLHVGVGDARVPQQPAQLRQVGRGLFGRADVRLAHDLDERDAAAVPVDERHRRRHVVVGRVVEELARVLLQVDAHEADGLRPRGRVDLDRPAGRDRAVELADLVALGQIRVEVVLAGEARVAVDLPSDRGRELHRKRHRAAVGDRERAREAQADRAGRGVGRRADRHRTRAEHLRARLELGVDLQPDDGINPRPVSGFDGGHREILTLSAALG